MADAFARWAWPSAWLHTVESDNGPEHVVVSIGPYYFDGDGMSSQRQLLERMKVVERIRNPRLIDFDRDRAIANGLSCPHTSSRKLLKLLEEHLGDPSSWGL